MISVLASPSTFRTQLRRARLLVGIPLLAIAPFATSAAAAQEDDARIRKLEQEVRALQRKVFPGGGGRYFEPEIAAPGATQPPPPTVGGPVTDLLSRMDAVEAALARLTAQSEVNANAIALLNARVENLETQQAKTPLPAESDGVAEAAKPPAPIPAATTAPAETTSASVEAVEMPDTGVAPEDAYVYGYRLWNAGRFADARTALEEMAMKYPAHRRASWARNLIGRAWLDEGKPRAAAEAFLKNYLDNRDGERAPDSLVYLSIATLQLGNKTKACEALEEFRLVYPKEAGGRLATLSGDTARKAGCN